MKAASLGKEDLRKIQASHHTIGPSPEFHHSIIYHIASLSSFLTVEFRPEEW